jgi:hypothetical protein
MNLRWFHALLILLSAALAVVFGVWCVAQYGRGGGTGSVLAAAAAFAVAIGLVLYDSWFLRKTRMLR